jgi:hypothetical protein
MSLNKFVKNFRKAIVITIFILGFIVSSISVSADATITVTPEKPTRKSIVTFTAEFDSDDIQSVYLKYNECYSDGCYSLYNKSMDPIGDNKFEVEITLLKDDTIYIQYYVEFESADGWSSSEVEKTYLSAGSSGDSNDTPGFEFLLFAVSIALVVIIFKRKRMK